MSEIGTTAVSGPLAEAEEISVGGFNKYVGPLYRLSDGADGAKRYAFAVTEKHMNAGGTVHGGMLMGFADVSMSRTARLVIASRSCSTVSLTCDFLAAGKLTDVIESRVRVTRSTRTLVFMSAEIVTEERLLLTASGVWKMHLRK